MRVKIEAHGHGGTFIGERIINLTEDEVSLIVKGRTMGVLTWIQSLMQMDLEAIYSEAESAKPTHTQRSNLPPLTGPGYTVDTGNLTGGK